MTREEAIKTLKGEAWICCAKKWNEALDMGVEALKQWDILDKIRAEISYKQEIELKGEDTSEWNECIKEVLEVIDKYIAEREVI